jgi:hypothetical protein
MMGIIPDTYSGLEPEFAGLMTWVTFYELAN